MSTDELIINMVCLKAGIVPFCGGGKGHIMNSLATLSPYHRRAAVRKFRKLLKSAIRQRALAFGQKGTPAFTRQEKYLRAATGLSNSGIKEKGIEEPAATITTSQSNIRAALVREYLRNNPNYNI